HLSSLDISKLDIGALKEFFAIRAPEPTAIGKAVSFLDYGKNRFETTLARRNVSLPNFGLSEVAIVIDGSVPELKPTQEFVWRMQAAKPNHTGWSPWIDLANSGRQEWQPYVFEGGWEALVIVQGHDAVFGDS